MSQDNISSVLQIITGDVFDLKADALVFPANHKPIIGGLLDGQVYEKADKNLLRADREKIGYLHGGETAITSSHGVPGYKYLIHAAVPIYKSVNSSDKLKSCYVKALTEADSNGLKSVVFCLLGTGYSHFPADYAEKCALKAITSFLDHHPDTCVKSIQLVKYLDHKKYKNEIKNINNIKKVNAGILADTAINPDSAVAARMKEIDVQIKKKLDERKLVLTDRYLAERDEYAKKNAKPYGLINVYDDFNNQQYYKIVHKYIDEYPSKTDTGEEFDRAKFAADIRLEDISNISRYLNLYRTRGKKKGKVYDIAKTFLNKKANVLRIGLGLKVSVDDMILLMLSRGHVFPSSTDDYIIANDYIEKAKWDKVFTEYSELIPNTIKRKRQRKTKMPDIEQEMD